MQELRLVAVSEDGTYAVLAVPGRGGRFSLPIDDRLRTVARGQFSRLAQYEIEVENPLRPKEIQDRIRAGETAEEIADAAGLPIDRVRRFEGPVLAEREYRAQEAQRSTVRGHTESGPGPRLGEIVADRLAEAGAPADTAEWDSRKRADGNWQVQLQFMLDGRPQLAEWVFDPRRRHVIPADDLARRLCLPQVDWPAGRLDSLGAPTATVTPIASRLSAHHGDPRPEPRDSAGRDGAGSGRPSHAPWSREAREPAWAEDHDRPAGPSRASEPSRSSEPFRPAEPARTTEAPRPAAAASRAGSGQPSGGQPSGAPAPAAYQPAAAHQPAPAHQPAAAAAHQAETRQAEARQADARQAVEARQAETQRGGAAAAAPSGAEQRPAGHAAAGQSGDATAAAEVPRPAEAEPAAAAAPARPGRKGRRSSVPSWDEIMLGNSRPSD
jgi:hypothetical protein